MTQRFGLEKFGGALGGAVTDEGGKFSSTDRDTIDRILAALEVHNHAGGTRLADPSGAPTLVLGEVGSLPAGTTFYYRVAYLDRYGLETAASDEVSISTPGAVSPPAQPVVTTNPGGALTPGLYYWAGSAVVDGVDTPLGDVALLTISDNGTAVLDFDELPEGADHIGVWRQGPSDSGFTRVGQTDSTLFIDDGSVPGDPCACDPSKMPPTDNLTGATSSVTVTLPVADAAVVGAFPVAGVIRWRLYRSTQSGVYPAESLVHEVIETTDGTAATGLVTSWTDDGSSPPTQGAPLAVSLTLTPSVPLAPTGVGGSAFVDSNWSYGDSVPIPVVASGSDLVIAPTTQWDHVGNEIAYVPDQDGSIWLDGQGDYVVGAECHVTGLSPGDVVELIWYGLYYGGNAPRQQFVCPPGESDVRCRFETIITNDDDVLATGNSFVARVYFAGAVGERSLASYSWRAKRLNGVPQLASRADLTPPTITATSTVAGHIDIVANVLDATDTLQFHAVVDAPGGNLPPAHADAVQSRFDIAVGVGTMTLSGLTSGLAYRVFVYRQATNGHYSLLSNQPVVMVA